MPSFPAPALPQPPAIILVMPALRTPPAVGAMPMRGGATAWPSASSAPRPRTGRRHCTAGSTLAPDDRPRLARPCSPALARPGTWHISASDTPVAARPVVSPSTSAHGTCVLHTADGRARAWLRHPGRRPIPLPAGANSKRLRPVSANTAATTDVASCAARAADPCWPGRAGRRPGHAGAAQRCQLPGCSRRARERPGPADTGVPAGRTAAGAATGQQPADPAGRFGLLVLPGRPGFLLARYEAGGWP
jgi:hypothetical protein